MAILFVLFYAARRSYRAIWNEYSVYIIYKAISTLSMAVTGVRISKGSFMT